MGIDVHIYSQTVSKTVAYETFFSEEKIGEQNSRRA